MERLIINNEDAVAAQLMPDVSHEALKRNSIALGMIASRKATHEIFIGAHASIVSGHLTGIYQQGEN